MKRNAKVTVNGWFKLLATIAFIVFDLIIATDSNKEGNLEVALALFAYTLLFVFLAVLGSNNKVAIFISDKKIFIYIFFVPTIVLSLYSGIYAGVSKGTQALGAFCILLTIFSIPFSFIMLFIQGGIRRWSGFSAFIALPVSLYVLCLMFPKNMIMISGVTAIITIVIFFIVGVIEYAKDHRADDAAERDTAESGGYKARWEDTPNSEVSNNQVIYLRGTIVVDYYGEFNQSSADDVIKGLINQYVRHVAKMPGYTIDKTAKVTIKYNN